MPDPTPDQQQALKAIATWRQAERRMIQEAKQRMWAEINAGPRRMVAHAIREALDLGVSKNQIKKALGNSNHEALEPYLGLEEVDRG